MDKITLYKNALYKYIKKEDNIEYNDDDLIIGILFLIIMNRYCKNSNINGHGYYISHAIIKNYYLIKNNKDIDLKIILSNIIKNIEYIKSRNDDAKTNIIINNFMYISKEIIKICDEIKNNEFDKQVNLLYYLMLLLAEYITIGEYYNPNMIKLGEYFSFIILSKNKNKEYYDYYELLKDSLDNLNIKGESINKFLEYVNQKN